MILVKEAKRKVDVLVVEHGRVVDGSLDEFLLVDLAVLFQFTYSDYVVNYFLDVPARGRVGYLLAFLLKVHAQYFEEVVTQLICGKNAALVLVQLLECFFQGINLDLLDLEPGQDGRDQSLEVGLSSDPFD